ncbi:MAG: hypothetical protein WDW38_002541 [Sanguina aurantia]
MHVHSSWWQQCLSTTPATLSTQHQHIQWTAPQWRIQQVSGPPLLSSPQAPAHAAGCVSERGERAQGAGAPTRAEADGVVRSVGVIYLPKGHLHQVSHHRGRSQQQHRTHAALDSQDKKRIYYWLNCPGGEVVPTLALYDTMQYVRSKTATVCYGLCLGMGGFLLTAGGEKVIRELSRNKWMDPKQAIEYGMIDKVLTTPMPKMPTGTKFNFSRSDEDTAGL